MQAQMLAPAAVLVLWSLLMLLWVGTTRFPAIAKSGMDIKNVPPGGRGVNLDGVLPDNVQWKSHNYTHLMEQPTIFYALCFALQFLDQANDINIGLAWLYVAIRIVHSLVQALGNFIPLRFLIFVLASVVLVALSVHAAIAVGFVQWSFAH